MSYFLDVRDFHRKFGLPSDGPARRLDDVERIFREKFMEEELKEYKEADTKADQLDALVDLCYVAIGTAVMQGFDFDEAWRRVHEANMKKVRVSSASQSKRGSTLDVVKPPGWTPPDHSDLVGE